jgi:uncharacterized repeat protein (TIGR03809 family)
MTYQKDVAGGRGVVARWHALAERRLEHLTELFDTGRWRRYHSERAFLENIREARTAVENWRDLSTSEASRNDTAADFFRLGHNEALLSSRSRDRIHVFQPQSAVRVAEPPLSNVSNLVEAGHVRSDAAPSASTMDNNPPNAMMERHSLLRNAL